MFPQLLIACDFDGTITRQDTLVEILNRFGSSDWREIQTEVVAGKLSIREGLKREMESVKATPEELKELLLTRVQIEPSFPPFLKGMRTQGIPVICLSGGFDLCVETVLAKDRLWPIPYLANRLVRNNGSWQIEFPYPSLSCNACGHCKADPIRSWNAQGYTTLFVGNGVTDRCAAQAAKLTFAKEELANWCKAQGIPVARYQTFDDIQAELTRRGWL